MDSNTKNILNSPIGQPMAAILFSRFGQRGTLALWSFVVIGQYVNHVCRFSGIELIQYTRYTIGFNAVGLLYLLLLLALILV